MPSINNYTAEQYLGQFCSEAEARAMSRLAGSNPSCWQRLMTAIHSNPQQDLARFTFQDLLGPDLDRHRNMFRARLNAVYCNPRVAQFVDDGTIDRRVLDLLQLLAKNQGRISTFLLPVQELVVEAPLVQAFIEEGLLYDHFYYDILELQVQSDLLFIRERLGEMGWKDHFLQAAWRLKHGLPRRQTQFEFEYFKDPRNSYEVRRFKQDSRIRQYHKKFEAIRASDLHSHVIAGYQLLWDERNTPRTTDSIKKHF